MWVIRESRTIQKLSQKTLLIYLLVVCPGVLEVFRASLAMHEQETLGLARILPLQLAWLPDGMVRAIVWLLPALAVVLVHLLFLNYFLLLAQWLLTHPDNPHVTRAALTSKSSPTIHDQP